MAQNWLLLWDCCDCSNKAPCHWRSLVLKGNSPLRRPHTRRRSDLRGVQAQTPLSCRKLQTGSFSRGELDDKPSLVIRYIFRYFLHFGSFYGKNKTVMERSASSWSILGQQNSKSVLHVDPTSPEQTDRHIYVSESRKTSSCPTWHKQRVQNVKVTERSKFHFSLKRLQGVWIYY